MIDYKLVPVEPTPKMLQVWKSMHGYSRYNKYKAMLDAAPDVQWESATWSGWGCQYPGKMPRLYGDLRIAELNCDWENGDQVLYFTAAPQPAEQQPAPDVAGLVEALETALFGTPLDDVPNRDNDDIWCLCYPHLPERASDVLRDHLARIEIALAAYRKGGDES